MKAQRELEHLSNNGTSLAKKVETRPQAGRMMFPQWALELIRPVVALLSRLLWKIEFYGVDNVPARGGVIIAANHQTYLDPFWLSLRIKRPTRYLAWSAAFRGLVLHPRLASLAAGLAGETLMGLAVRKFAES